MEIRQSLKMVKLAYVLCLLAEVAFCVIWFGLGTFPNIPAISVVPLPIVLAVFVAIRHFRRRMTLITISGDRLRYETGLFSKTTRTMELAKVQDVRVDQAMFQRMIGVGDISLETAGESSRIVMTGIDNPTAVANHILDMARAVTR
jgi:membrane protein YdbS with pleckstrin-like domain